MTRTTALITPSSILLMILATAWFFNFNPAAAMTNAALDLRAGPVAINGVELGDSRETVVRKLGPPARDDGRWLVYRELQVYLSRTGRVAIITGTALSQNRQVLLRKGDTESDVERVLGVTFRQEVRSERDRCDIVDVKIGTASLHIDGDGKSVSTFFLDSGQPLP